MAITYQYKVVRMETETSIEFTDAITYVLFKVIGTDENGNSAEICNCVGLEPSSNNFISYSDLDENTVIQWCLDRTPSDDINWMQQACASKIQKATQVINRKTNFPWTNQE
jgi:hypothetical protein